jgi:diaminopropionate ammonia-lyase
VEGYTTILLEIDEQLRGVEPNVIVIPCGVGSLAQTVVTHYKNKTNHASSPNAVLTVEPRTAGSLHESLKAGTSLSISTSSTIMTGLECGTISTAAWPVLKEGVDVSVTVSDSEVHEAVLELEREGVGAGPCGAAALAGLRFVASVDPKLLHFGLDGESVVVLICTEGEREYAVPVREH